MNIISCPTPGQSRKRPSLLAMASLASLVFMSMSCSSTKNNASTNAAGGQYAEYTSAADGGYHPYSSPQGYSKPAYQPPSQSYSEPAPKRSSSYSSYSSTTKKKTPSRNVSSYSSQKKSSYAKSSGTTHIVKRGDTLYALARRYHTTVTAIKRANGKTSDMLRDGEKLRIP